MTSSTSTAEETMHPQLMLLMELQDLRGANWPSSPKTRPEPVPWKRSTSTST
jgi:hypothetical protein